MMTSPMPNFNEIHQVALKIKHTGEWMHRPSPLFIYFMHIVQTLYKNISVCGIKISNWKLTFYFLIEQISRCLLSTCIL
jgi:hypothetical protein